VSPIPNDYQKPRSRSRKEQAVVLGGSMAGLLTARVLSEHFEEVTVVDRDVLDVGARPRRGAPQARHLHGLLARGHTVVEGMFPGLTDELARQGAPTGDMLADTQLLFGGHRFRRGPSGLTALCVSRPALEAAVRRRVASLPQVSVLEGYDAVGLIGDAERRQVVAARVFDRRDGSAERQLAGDLFVDATGRGSRLPSWLQSLGVTPPQRETVEVGVCYASRRYRLRPQALGEDLVLISAPTPGRPRGGALTRIEGDQCLVTMIGVLGDDPASDPAAFDEFLADLALPDIREALEGAEPLAELARYRHRTSVRNRYDRLADFPDGLLVLGDAVCTLNPIYGQGMTVAALEAARLGDHLATGHPLRSRRYVRDVGRISGVAWELARGADLAFAKVPGRRRASAAILNKYVGRVQAGAARDPRLGRAFLRVTGLVDPPTALLRPDVAARALVRGSEQR
jgi:2-polyprenyl-6-methoxyphenol hydroxylase-like FAD-dependent oxidoreductase